MEIYNLSTGAITAVGVSLLVIFSIVGLIIWNNKAKEQVNALKSIDAKIQEGALETPEPEVVVEITTECEPEEESEVVPVPEPEIAFAKEKEEEPEPEVMENNYNVGKSGKVYSKNELLELIRS